MEPKKPAKKKRFSTMNFPSTSKNLEKLGEVDKVSKRKVLNKLRIVPLPILTVIH